MDQPSEPARCAVCGEEGDPAAMCWLHDEGCPRAGDPAADVTCGCDALAHESCCPLCHPEHTGHPSTAHPCVTVDQAGAAWAVVEDLHRPDRFSMTQVAPNEEKARALAVGVQRLHDLRGCEARGTEARS